MKWKTNGKRFLALLLTAVLLLSVCPVTASAEETDGLCPHHTAHDATCGYQAATEGVACNMDCQPDENGVTTHAEGCAFVAATEGQPCTYECKECNPEEPVKKEAPQQEPSQAPVDAQVQPSIEDGPGIIMPLANGTGEKFTINVVAVYENGTVINSKTLTTTCKNTTSHDGYNHNINLKEFYPSVFSWSTTGWAGWCKPDATTYTGQTLFSTFYSWNSTSTQIHYNIQGSEPYKAVETIFLVYNNPTPTTYSYKVTHVYRTNGTEDGRETTTVSKVASGTTVYAANITNTTYNGNTYTYTSGSPVSAVINDNSKTFTLYYDRTVQTAPDKPTDDQVNELLKDGAVKIDCINSNVTHADKVYSLQAGTYTIGEVQSSAAAGYTCTVTVDNAAPYVTQYNTDMNVTHTLSPETQTPKSITLEYKDGTWAVQAGTAPVTFTVTCTSTTITLDKIVKVFRGLTSIDQVSDDFSIAYTISSEKDGDGTIYATGTISKKQMTETPVSDYPAYTMDIPSFEVPQNQPWYVTIQESNAAVSGYTCTLETRSKQVTYATGGSTLYFYNNYTEQSTTDWSGLTIEKKAASTSDTVKPGDTITYTITVKNGTGKDLKNVTVSEKLNENLTFANATPSSQYDKDKGVWTIDTLANNGTAVLTITATVNKDVEDDTKIANTAAITGAEDSDGGKPGEDDKLPEDSADVTVTIPQEDSALTVTKTADKAEVAPGETVTYTISVKNNTSETISGIVLKDILPDGLADNMTVGGGGFTSASGEITFESFDLAAGKTETFTVTVAYANVTESVIKTNTATATSGDKDYTDTADVTVEPAESTEVAGYYIMKITKSFKGISEVPEGFYLSYQYTDLATQKLVTGRATLEASTDDPLLLKGEIMYPYYKNPTSPNYEVKFTEHNADVEGYRREVRSGGSISIMYAVKDPLTYTVYSVEQDGLVTYEYLIENTYSKNTNWDSLTIGKTADKTEVKPGDTVTYTITVENKTGKDLKNVTVSEQLDTNLTFVSATPSNGQYDNGTGRWTIATLADNATATLTIKATVKDGVADGTTIGNTATITDAKTDDDETLPEDDQPTDSVDITVKPDEPVKPDWDELTIVKSANPKAVKRGETITYTILVKNNTGVKLDTVTVQETPDSNLTVTGYSQGAAYDAKNNVWTITGLENGAEATLTVTATVNTDTTASDVWNTASIISASAEGGETLTGNPSDSISVVVTDPNPIDPEPETDWDGLTLKKTANRSSVRPGKTITYTLTVTNKTGKDLTDIVVSEKLDTNLTFVSSSGDGKYDVKTGEWTIGKLENGGKATLTLKATVKTGLKDGTVIKNTACITDAEAENGDTLPTDAQPSGSVNVTVSNKISLIPETGDTSNIGLWIGVLVACAVVLGVVLILTVKKKKTR